MTLLGRTVSWMETNDEGARADMRRGIAGAGRSRAMSKAVYRLVTDEGGAGRGTTV